MRLKQYLTEINWNLRSGDTYYHYGKGKGLAGLWGAIDPKLYSHFGGKPKEIEFDAEEKLAMVKADGYDTVPSEAMYHQISSPLKDDYDHFVDLDEVELHMDLVCAIEAKKKGVAGIVFNFGNWKKSQVLDIRNHTLSELKKNYKKSYDGKVSYF